MMSSRQPAPWQPRPAADPHAMLRRARRLARWAAKAPADRLSLPGAAAIYGTGAVLHATGVPLADVAVVGAVALPAVTYGAVLHRSHSHGNDTPPAWRASKAAFGVMMAGTWAAVTARWGLTFGPDGASSLVFVGGTGVAYAMLRLDEETRKRRDWRDEKIRWHQVSKLYGLEGSHLLSTQVTRLGRMMIVDVTRTGRRASMIAGHDTAERIAEHKRLPSTRVQVHPDRIAGRIRISVRDRDPWACAIPHPALDDAPEIELPARQSVTDPLIVGQDPETGKPLEVTLYDEDGAKGLFVIGLTGSGKTVLLNDLAERLTACDDVLIWDINLSKAKENRRWAPACDLTAHGPKARRDALAILRLARKVIEYRGNSDSDDAVHVPTPQDPAIVVRVDEMDALQGGNDWLSNAIKDELNKINSKKRSEGVVLIEAGQRGVTTHAGNADIRANFDTFALAKVRGRSEMMHAAGDMGMDLPDMTTYGEGHPGVWAFATLGGEVQMGRTFKLKELADISRLADDRRPQATLPLGLREYLGDAYARLRAGEVTAHQAPGDKPLDPFMAALEKELTDAMGTDIFDQMDQVAEKNRETRRQLEQMGEEELIELGPEHQDALRAAIEERNRQAAMTVEISSEVRAALLARLAAPGGTSSGDLMAALDLGKTTVWRYLRRLAVEGLAERRGEGRGARWYLKEDRAA